MASYVTRWDPFREAVTLREAMDRLFEDSFVPSGRREGARRERPSGCRWMPTSRRTRSSRRPICPASSLRMSRSLFEGDTLTIKGERPGPIENVDYVMRAALRGFNGHSTSTSRWTRTRPEAKYEHGLLTLSIPKTEAVKPKTIVVVTK